jgi:hypothetical protein
MKGKKSPESQARRRSSGSKSNSPVLKGMTGEIGHFSGSAFQNSPDPSCLPVPSFDDDETPIETPKQVKFFTDRQLVELSSTTVFSGHNKTEKLRSLLNIRPQVLAV